MTSLYILLAVIGGTLGFCGLAYAMGQRAGQSKNSQQKILRTGLWYLGISVYAFALQFFGADGIEGKNTADAFYLLLYAFAAGSAILTLTNVQKLWNFSLKTKVRKKSYTIYLGTRPDRT